MIQPVIYTLRYFTPSGEGRVMGSYSSLARAQAEAHHQHPSSSLTWEEFGTDDPRCAYLAQAALSGWFTPGCKIEIAGFELDSHDPTN